MSSKRILLPAHTVAEWGGVHEWVVEAIPMLASDGYEVTVAGAGDVFIGRALSAGAEVIELDWSDTVGNVDILTRSGPFDVVFAHGVKARELALALPHDLRHRLYVMVHGAYHDRVYFWKDRVDGLIATSPSLVSFLADHGRVEPWRISVVPNGVHDSEFQGSIMPFGEKTKEGIADIVIASRLAREKLGMLDAVEECLRVGRDVRSELRWNVVVFGDGPERDAFARRLGRLSRELGNVSTEFGGWVSPEEVSQRLSRAVLSVGAGRGALRAIAAGALCVGVGARKDVGLQFGDGLRAGLWSNFGDYPCEGYRPPSLRDVLPDLLIPEAYDDAVRRVRAAVSPLRSHSAVKADLVAALGI